MDFFKLGLRNIFGITLPGAIVVIVFCYAFIVLSTYLGFSSDMTRIKEFSFLIFTILFAFSYVIGNIIRLEAAENVDNLSRGFHIRENAKKKSRTKYYDKETKKALNSDQIFEEVKKKYEESEEKAINYLDDKNIKDLILILKILDERKVIDINATINKHKQEKIKLFFPRKHSEVSGIPNRKIIKKYIIPILQEVLKRIKTEFINDKTKSKWYRKFPGIENWCYYVDEFPYNLWVLKKIESHYPSEVKDFFKGKYEDLLIKEKFKCFFNYCKMEIIASGKNKGEEMIEEVFSAEANSRFFAGTYKALVYSKFVLLVFSMLSIFVSLNILYKIPIPLSFVKTSFIWPFSNFVFSTLLLSVMWFFKRTIIKEYRSRRLKEVATVYDAFYLVHKDSDLQNSENLKVNKNG